MIHIKYDVRDSRQDNIGFFADQNIKKNEIIYSPSADYSSDEYISDEGYYTLDKSWQQALQRWGEPDNENGGWFRKFDFMQCTNSSDTPNMIKDSKDQLIAVRDIKAGEELTRSH